MKVLKDEGNECRLDHEAGGWLQDGSCHVKVVSSYGDPVELSAGELRALAAAFTRFADKLDAELDIEPGSVTHQ